MHLRLAEISVDDENHRADLDEEALATLQASIHEHGLQSPIMVGRNGRPDAYVLIYGHRRLEAIKRLGWEHVDAFVADLPADRHERARFIQEQRAVENLDRANLTPIDEAIAVAALVRVELDRAGLDAETCEPGQVSAACEVVANQIGRSATWVRDRSYLSTLGGEARSLVQAGRLPLGHAREICKIADPKERDRLAGDAARHDDGHGGVSLDWIRRAVQAQMHSLRTVPWTLVDAFAGCPACATCPHNSANDLQLFEHDKTPPEAGVCLNPRCFDVKTRAVQRDLKKAAEKVAKYCKAHECSATPSIAGQVPGVPVHVKPAGVARLAKVSIEGKPAAKTPAATSGGSGAGAGYQRSAKEIAEGRYHDDRRKWNNAAQQAFEAAFADWAFEALLVLSHDAIEILPEDSYDWNAADPWHPKHEQEERKILAGFATPAMRTQLERINLLAVAGGPVLASLLAPVRKRLVQEGARACVSWRCPTWTIAMGKAFGVTLADPPVYEPPTPAKPAGKPKARKPRATGRPPGRVSRAMPVKLRKSMKKKPASKPARRGKKGK